MKTASFQNVLFPNPTFFSRFEAKQVAY